MDSTELQRELGPPAEQAQLPTPAEVKHVIVPVGEVPRRLLLKEGRKTTELLAVPVAGGLATLCWCLGAHELAYCWTALGCFYVHSRGLAKARR